MPRSPDRPYEGRGSYRSPQRRERSPRPYYDTRRHDERSPPRYQHRPEQDRYRRDDSRSPPRYYERRGRTPSPSMDSPPHHPSDAPHNSDFPPPPLDQQYQRGGGRDMSRNYNHQHHPPQYDRNNARQPHPNDHPPHRGHHSQQSTQSPPPPPPTAVGTVRGPSGTERPSGVKPFNPEQSVAFHSTARWNCQTCGFTNYGPASCGSCGTPRPAAEQGLLHTPSVEEAPSSRRYVITNELCFSRMPSNITESDMFEGLSAILKDYTTVDVSEALRGMKIDLSSGVNFPSALALVSFREIEPAARIYETVRRNGQRFLGAKVRVEFSRRSILRLQRGQQQVVPGEDGESAAELRSQDTQAGEGEGSASQSVPASNQAFAPVWHTLDDLRATLSAIDENWTNCTDEMKQFYNTHLPMVTPAAAETGNTVAQPAAVASVTVNQAEIPVPSPPPPPPPPPAASTSGAAPQTVAAPAPAKALSFAERIALAKQKAAAEHAAASISAPAAAAAAAPAAAAIASEAPHSPNAASPSGPSLAAAPTEPLLRVLQLPSLTAWPRFGFVAAANINGNAVVRASAQTTAVFPVHPRLDQAISLSIPQHAVIHSFERVSTRRPDHRESLLGYPAFPWE